MEGAGTPVCDAYVDRLNRSEFVNYPFCDRPESGAAEEFVRLERQLLSDDEIARLYDPVGSLIATGDPQQFARAREERRRRGWGVRDDGSAAKRDAGSNRKRLAEGVEPLFYRFSPSVDIDNDGNPDDIISWKQTGVPCGQRSSPVNGGSEVPVRTPTYLLVLDPSGNVDASKTREIFGHPAGDSVTYADADGRERTLSFSNKFRTVGYSYGTFVYRGATYFDTFYGSTGDFASSRVDDPGITNVLAVMKREDQETMLVCEIRWNADVE
jgi:hypothetical protein